MCERPNKERAIGRLLHGQRLRLRAITDGGIRNDDDRCGPWRGYVCSAIARNAAAVGAGAGLAVGVGAGLAGGVGDGMDVAGRGADGA